MAETEWTLEKLYEQKKPICVKNNTQPMGDVAIIVFGRDGQSQIVVVPKTWIPVDLTAQVTHKTLYDSDDFRKQLRGQTLILMDPNKAMEILNTPDAREESDRIFTSSFANIEGAKVDKTKANKNIQDFLNSIGESETISVTVQEILSRDISDNEKYHLLRAETKALAKEDFQHIILQTEHQKTKTWAQEALDKM